MTIEQQIHNYLILQQLHKKDVWLENWKLQLSKELAFHSIDEIKKVLTWSDIDLPKIDKWNGERLSKEKEIEIWHKAKFSENFYKKEFENLLNNYEKI